MHYSFCLYYISTHSSASERKICFKQRLKSLNLPQKKLVDELEQLRSAGKKVKRKPKKEEREPKMETKVEDVLPTDEEDDEFEDRDKDPDWRATPLFKRIQVSYCTVIVS